MSRFSRPDIYTLLIVALIPVALGLAGGLTWWDNKQIHDQQCAVATEWLESTANIASQYQNAGTMDRTAPWITSFEEINSPRHAGTLRRYVIAAAKYGFTWRWTESTRDPGNLMRVNTYYDDSLNESVDKFVDYCPETESLVSDAFPMLFPDYTRKDD